MTKFGSKLVRPKSVDPDPAGSRNDLSGRTLIIPDPHPDWISQDPQRIYIHNSALDSLTFTVYYFALEDCQMWRWLHQTVLPLTWKVGSGSGSGSATLVEIDYGEQHKKQNWKLMAELVFCQFQVSKGNFSQWKVKIAHIEVPREQWTSRRFRPCCGSGSGSTCFWASRIRIRIHLLKVWIRIRILLWIRIRILLSSCKISKKNFDSYYFVTLFELLSLKNDVNVASKSHKQKKLC